MYTSFVDGVLIGDDLVVKVEVEGEVFGGEESITSLLPPIPLFFLYSNTSSGSEIFPGKCTTFEVNSVSLSF